MAADTLNIEEPLVDDASIFSQQFFPFNPITGTEYNQAGIIQINIENQAEYFLPHKSWLQIDGDMLRDNDQRYVAANDISLTNNGILYCFSNIKYQLGGNEIESVNYPGQATTMMGLLKYENSYPGLGQCWTPDSNNAIDDNTGFAKRKGFFLSSNPTGAFSFAIDLQHIFGFAEDYQKVVYGLRHSLQFNRNASNNDALYKAPAIPAGKIVIRRITWWVPTVIPSPVESYRLGKLLEGKVTIPAGFRNRQCAMVNLPLAPSYTWNLGVRTERPRFVIIGLQTNKSDNQVQNAALFDHVNVRRMRVLLNSTEYPAVDVLSDFTRNEFSGYYKMMADFKEAFYGVDRTVSSGGIDADKFKSLYPLFVLDVSKQVEKFQSSIVDVSVKMDFAANVAANTIAYALIISDRKLTFECTGKKINVVF